MKYSEILFILNTYRKEYEIFSKKIIIRLVNDIIHFIYTKHIIQKTDDLIIFKDDRKSIWGDDSLNIIGKIITACHLMLKYNSFDSVPKSLEKSMKIDLNISDNYIITYITNNFNIDQINTKYRSEKSYNGFSLDILKSALQKYIRRGILNKALYFAIEICLFIFTLDNSNQKRIITNFVHRLQIIFLEDVGLGCYNKWDNIDKLFDVLLNTKNKKRDLNLFIFNYINLVVTMTLNRHTRVCSHYNSFKTVISKDLNKMESYMKYFPTFNKYYKLVKSKNKDNKYENYKNSITDKEIDAGYWVGNIDIDETLKIDTLNKIYIPLKDIKFSDISKKWTKELKDVKERFLPYYTSILYNYFEKDLKLQSKIFSISNLELLQYLMVNLNHKLEVDDYVIDMHTKKGKNAGKGNIEFVYEGSKVKNELYINNEALEMKNFYNFSKLLYQENKIDKEFLKSLIPIKNL